MKPYLPLPQWPALLLSLCLIMLCSCKTRSSEPREEASLCRVIKTVYFGGPKVCDEILVKNNGRYVCKSFDVGSTKPASTEYEGHLSSRLAAALAKDVQSGSGWIVINGLPTIYVNVDDSLSKISQPVDQLLNVVR